MIVALGTIGPGADPSTAMDETRARSGSTAVHIEFQP